MSVVNRHIQVTGKVQGVFFRASAVRKAQELGIAGWVKNVPDGSVAAEAEGEEAGVETFIGWCRQGPPGARVAEVKVEDGTVKRYESFEIIR